jgi:hypothetical protein
LTLIPGGAKAELLGSLLATQSQKFYGDASSPAPAAVPGAPAFVVGHPPDFPHPL